MTGSGIPEEVSSFQEKLFVKTESKTGTPYYVYVDGNGKPWPRVHIVHHSSFESAGPEPDFVSKAKVMQKSSSSVSLPRKQTSFQINNQQGRLERSGSLTDIVGSCQAPGAKKLCDPLSAPQDEFEQRMHELVPKSLLVPWSAVHMHVKVSDKGATAQVYEGLLDGYPTAVKVLRTNSVSKHRLESFAAEATILPKLSHRHIIKLKGLVAESPYALLLELVSFPASLGSFETMFDFLWNVRHGGKAISSGAQWAWTKQLLQAIAYLHSQQILHLDIKTSNILLDASASVKLIDFGRAREVDSTLSLVLHSDPGGTPRYLPPEMLVIPAHLSDRADVWSTACSVIEILGGRIPFEELISNADVKLALAAGHLPEVPPCGGVEMEGLLRAAFDPLPANRPTSQQLCHEVFHMSDPIASACRAK